jgi:hypothetical protein
MLEDRAFIAANGDEIARVEKVQLLVIRHRNPSRWFPVVRTLCLDAETLGLFDGLRANCKRSKQKHVLVRSLNDVLRPCKLHQALTQPTIGKDRGSPFPASPVNKVTLEIKYPVREEGWLESVFAAELAFSVDELLVGVFCHAPDSLPLRRSRLNKKGSSRENKPDEKTCQSFRLYAL